MESAGGPIVAALASHGLPGVVIALLVFWIFLKDKAHTAAIDAKDKELKAERDARIADAKLHTETALNLQKTAIDVANKLADVFEELQKRMPR